MNSDKLQFVETSPSERKLLLDALNYDKPLVCAYCGIKLNYISCSVMPGVKDREVCTIICANNILCVTQYLIDFDNYKPKKSKNIKTKSQINKIKVR